MAGPNRRKFIGRGSAGFTGNLSPKAKKLAQRRADQAFYNASVKSHARSMYGIGKRRK